MEAGILVSGNQSRMSRRQRCLLRARLLTGAAARCAGWAGIGDRDEEACSTDSQSTRGPVLQDAWPSAARKTNNLPPRLPHLPE